MGSHWLEADRLRHDHDSHDLARARPLDDGHLCRALNHNGHDNLRPRRNPTVPPSSLCCLVFALSSWTASLVLVLNGARL